MKITINQLPHDMAAGTTLADALRRIEARPPFAAAVNQQFVPSARYPQTLLQENDQIEVIQPVTGG